MTIDYKYCDYLSPHNSTKYVYLWRDVTIDQAQCICNMVMLLATKLDAQYQQHNTTIHKIFLEEIPILLSRCEEPKRHKR